MESDQTDRGADGVGGVSASTGDLELSVSAVDGTARFGSSTGDVAVPLAPDLDLDLTAETNTGDVTLPVLRDGSA